MAIVIRNAKKEDLDEITSLFLNTIRHINRHDYTDNQLKVWQSSAEDRERWLKKINDQEFLVAIAGGEIAGFSSITKAGYLDMMFVHKNHQRKGIAKKLLNLMVEYAGQNGITEIITEASITARPFFEKHGFEVQKKQVVNRKNIGIPNFKMRMTLEPPLDGTC